MSMMCAFLRLCQDGYFSLTSRVNAFACVSVFMSARVSLRVRVFTSAWVCLRLYVYDVCIFVCVCVRVCANARGQSYVGNLV